MRILFLIVAIPFAAAAEAPEKTRPPLAVRLIAKRTAYPWEARDAKARERPEPVALVFEFTNQTKGTLQIVGPPEPALLLKGPDGKDIKPRDYDRFFVAPRASWRLKPGETARLPLHTLAFHDKTRRLGFVWPGPGTYALRAEFSVLVHPAPPGSAEEALPGAAAGEPKFGRITLSAPPVTLEVTKGSVVGFWSGLLKDKDADVRAAALAAIKELGKVDAGGLEAIGPALTDADPATRKAALEALAALGKASRPLLKEAVRRLQDEEIEVRLAAVAALGSIDSKDAAARAALIPVLRDPIANVRRRAAEEMRLLIYDNPVVEPKLREALIDALQNDPDEPYQTYLIRALGYVPHPDALAAILPFVRSKNLAVSSSAITTAGDIIAGLPKGADRTRVPDAVKELTEALKDKERRDFAAFSLQHMRPEGRAAIPTLIWALDDPDSFPKTPNTIRVNLLRTLGAFGPDAEAAGPALVRRLHEDENWQVRAFAADAIGKLGKAGRRYLPDLRRAREDKMDQVRSAAAEAIKTLGR